MSFSKDCCTGLPVQGWGLPWQALQVLAPGRGLHCLHVGPVGRPNHVKQGLQLLAGDATGWQFATSVQVGLPGSSRGCQSYAAVIATLCWLRLAYKALLLMLQFVSLAAPEASSHAPLHSSLQLLVLAGHCCSLTW